VAKVLTVVDALGLGGTQRNAATYARLYSRAGFDSGLLALHGGGPREEEVRAERVTLYIGGQKDAVRRQALNAAVAWRPDIVHIHREGYTDPKTAEVLLAFQESGARIIETNVFARVDYSPVRSTIWVHLLLSQWCLWKWRRWARGLAPAPTGTVIPNAVQCGSFFPEREAGARLRERYGIPQDALVLGRVGQPIEGKWAPIIVDAFRHVAAAEARAYLLLVGPPPSVRERLSRLPARVADRVRVIQSLDSDDALRACYSAMNVFLHASRIGESFGFVLCEAMLCGLPVVTWNRPLKDNSQLEVVGHGRGGLVVNGLNSMVEAVAKLLSDQALREKMGSAGAAWVAAHYDAPVVQEKLARLADRVLSAGSRSDLATWLERDHNFCTEVDKEYIWNLLLHSMGPMPCWTKCAMGLVHTPYLYRAYLRLKGRPA